MNKLSKLNDIMKEKIIGQSHAIDTILKCLLRSECNLNSINRPLASFLFYGASGTGKTEFHQRIKAYSTFQEIDSNTFYK